MSTITGGELLVKCLKAEGIDAMFGIIDGSHVPFVGHLGEYGIRYVNAHHEEAAVHMAEGYARVARRTAAVIGNPGPGGANMISGLSSAFGEGTPVLAITCTRRTATTQPDRGGAWQATDLYEMAKPVTKYSALVHRVDRIPELVRAAARACMTGHKGPSLLVIPDEFLGQEIEADDLRLPPAAQYRVEDMGAGDPNLIARAARLLVDSKSVYIHAGSGVQWADAGDQMVALGEFLDAAMGSTVGARGVIPEDHPNYFNAMDLGAAGAARNDADTVLVVGSRLGEYEGWGMPPLWGDPDNQTTIEIDADPASIGLNRPVDLPIVADAGKGLTALLDEVRRISSPQDNSERLATYHARSAETMDQMTEYLVQPTTTGVNPAQLVTIARQVLPPETVLAVDGGNIALTATGYFPILRPMGYLYSVKMGYLGTGLPFGIGAKVADPDRPMCVISGDGAIGFSIMELETAVRHDLPLIVIVAVDEAWGMEKSAFTSRGFGDDFVDIGISGTTRYDKVAEALGCFGAYVDTIDDLPEAIESATQSGRPALIHVAVDEKLNELPPARKLFKYLRTL